LDINGRYKNITCKNLVSNEVRIGGIDINRVEQTRTDAKKNGCDDQYVPTVSDVSQPEEIDVYFTY